MSVPCATTSVPPWATRRHELRHMPVRGGSAVELFHESSSKVSVGNSGFSMWVGEADGIRDVVVTYGYAIFHS
jgi:hypothetical protein